MAGTQRKSATPQPPADAERSAEATAPDTALVSYQYKILAHGSGGWIDQDRGEDQPRHKQLGTLLNECGEEGWQVVGTYQTPTDHQPRVILMRPRR